MYRLPENKYIVAVLLDSNISLFRSIGFSILLPPLFSTIFHNNDSYTFGIYKLTLSSVNLLLRSHYTLFSVNLGLPLLRPPPTMLPLHSLHPDSSLWPHYYSKNSNVSWRYTPRISSPKPSTFPNGIPTPEFL